MIGRSYSETTRRARVAVEFQRSGKPPRAISNSSRAAPQARRSCTRRWLATARPRRPSSGSPTWASAGPPRRDQGREGLPPRQGWRRHERRRVHARGALGVAVSLPYSNRKTFTGKEKGEKSLPDDALEGGALLGTLVTLHARQHVYGKSWSHQQTAGRRWSPTETLRAIRGKLVSYTEHRPPGEPSPTAARRCPDTGYVPVKNCYMYGQSYGKATALANEVEAAVRSGSDPLGMAELVDARPTGAPNLTMQIYASAGSGG